jgi:hypothetical protein
VEVSVSAVVDRYVGGVGREGETFAIIDAALAGLAGITDKGAKDTVCVAEFAPDMP